MFQTLSEMDYTRLLSLTARLLPLLFFMSLLPSYFLNIPSSTIPIDSVVSHTGTNIPPTPTIEIQHKHTCNQANFSLSCIHPPFHPTIHPSSLTSKEDGASDAALASAAPPLKGHTCSLLWPTVLH